MLSVLGHGMHRPTPVWNRKKMEKKSTDILKAIEAGHSCEQILAGDKTVTYHDIFHALTEAPTSHWRKASARSREPRVPSDMSLTRTRQRHRRD
jgi:hypothetical protein